MMRLFVWLALLPCVSSSQEDGNLEVAFGRTLQSGNTSVCFANLMNGTTLTFQEGQSFGNAFSNPCGSSADYPCFCNSTEKDHMTCPYCPFYTANKNFVCAKSGENITFVDEFGIEQTCSCQYVGNNKAQTSCTPKGVPNRVCSLQRNTDRCANLTKYMNFDPNCTCANFCLDQFSGCCDYGGNCSVTCPGGATVNDIVSGCQIDPFKPPVARPPSQPVSAPVPSPRGCILQVNTENCAVLTAIPVTNSSCGTDSCYNYCDDKFHGCCSVNDMSCSIKCTGPGPSKPVITAGCKMGQSCGLFGEACSQNIECCSERCLMGQCARRGPLRAARMKLSSGHGGAAGGTTSQGGGGRQLLDEDAKIRGS